MPVTVRQLLAAAKERLTAAPFDARRREANLLLAHILGISEAQLLARDELEVRVRRATAFEALLGRRLLGEPVAYLTGRREFYGRTFDVDSRVLVPRPETEHLIAAALDLELPARPRVLDLGTGSGCIAVTLALELKGARVLAGDRSVAALEVAARNARALAPGAVAFFCGDWLAAVDPSALDLVVTNPPYVARDDASTLSREIVDFEPHEALFADEDGLADYDRLYAGLERLRPGTPVVVEIGFGQESAVLALARRHGFSHRRTVTDYGGISRVVVVNRK